MNPGKSPPLYDGDEEISALIARLHKTGQRLEELTGGEVDTVADREGRTFLLRQAQEHLRHIEEAKQAAILNALPAHIALLDTRGLIISVNEAWRRFGSANVIHGPGYGVGLNYLELCDAARGEGSSEAHQVAKGIRSVLGGEAKSFSIEYACRSPTEQRWFLLTVTPLADDLANRVVVMHLNITEEKRAKDELRELALQVTHSAEHDFLTGLPNRMLLKDRVSQAIASARRHSKQLAVLFLDLDGFKHINDSLGHSTGDKLLQSIAGRLVSCVRGSDTVSRQGGDEFVVLLSEVQQSEDPAITARRMLQAVAQAHSIEQHHLHVTTSIGVSVYPHDGLDAETLIKNADTAMYQAKENGRQSYQFFKPAMNVRAVERQFIESSLRHALERRELALYYQPKVSLKTGAITGAEALIRWTHPTRGSIAPAQFIPIAEDSGLILQIGNWALREACTQARAWADAGLPLATIAVNVSAREIQDENFVEGVCAILKDTGLDPRFLELELSESALMKRAETTASILQALRERGMQVVVDDFGTGYSSFSYLQKFPIDALKIDRSFVRQTATAAGETSIATAVISVGRSLKLRVVADGVETREELAFLQANQCDEAQGDYVSPPVPPQQFACLLKSGMPQVVVSAQRRVARLDGSSRSRDPP
jgi:diguanylate cyclase (GGDEF)-like protein